MRLLTNMEKKLFHNRHWICFLPAIPLAIIIMILLDKTGNNLLLNCSFALSIAFTFISILLACYAIMFIAILNLIAQMSCKSMSSEGKNHAFHVFILYKGSLTEGGAKFIGSDMIFGKLGKGKILDFYTELEICIFEKVNSVKVNFSIKLNFKFSPKQLFQIAQNKKYNPKKENWLLLNEILGKIIKQSDKWNDFFNEKATKSLFQKKETEKIQKAMEKLIKNILTDEFGEFDLHLESNCISVKIESGSFKSGSFKKNMAAQ